MNAYSRSTLATAEKHLRKCAEYLRRVPSATVFERASLAEFALADASAALEEIDRAVHIEALTEAAE